MMRSCSRRDARPAARRQNQLSEQHTNLFKFFFVLKVIMLAKKKLKKIAMMLYIDFSVNSIFNITKVSIYRKPYYC